MRKVVHVRTRGLYVWVLGGVFFFFQAEDGIRDAQESRGLGDVYKRQVLNTDDPYGKRLAGELEGALTYGFRPGAHIRPVSMDNSATGLVLELSLIHI